MLKSILMWTGVALASSSCLLAWSAQGPPGSTPPPAASHRRLLDRYCVACHSEKLRTAGLVLETMDLGNVSAGAPVWEKVVRKLRTGAMPPPGAPRPDKAGYDSLASYLETELDRAAAAHPNPGRPAVQRLNRTEYAGAVRDLLALEIDAASLLPADESTNGFDNNGTVLSVSPLLMERYLSAARKISRLAVGDIAAPAAFETYEVHKYLRQEEGRISEDLPFGSRGGIAIRHYFPLDAEYVIRVRLQRNTRDYIRGLAESHQLDVRLNGARIKRFAVGGEHRGRSTPVFSSASLGDPAQEEYERGADDGMEVRVRAKAGMGLVQVYFLKETTLPEGPLSSRLTQTDFAQYKGGRPGVGSVTIGGPYDATAPGETPSRRRIFVCRPASADEEEPCARKILSALARRAFRRPVTDEDDEDIATLLDFYRAGRRDGDFEAGIRTALERILLGPEFLFRIERDPEGVPPGAAYGVSDLELASRLSFFLWNSIPDDELLDLAVGGKLKDPAALEQQVRRMLGDPRSQALVSNFAGQWLFIRNLRSVTPDPEAFPYFDENLRRAFQQETELFFGSIAREDRSVLDLLRADYAFVDERLARHYGIPNVYGNRFRRVKLGRVKPGNEARRGLLGQGSILTVTSYANRTSPVLRGKWVLDNILGTPPPPPPPNVPSLKDRDEDGPALTMRQRMEQHRANPVCASCHQQMDPLGFALENFDGIGAWRTADTGAPIDSSGVLPDGTRFQGPAELRKILLSRREEFVTALTEKLLTYAVGRGLEYYDAPAVRKILREAAPGDYRWSALIQGITRSVPFQMRRSREP